MDYVRIQTNFDRVIANWANDPSTPPGLAESQDFCVELQAIGAEDEAPELTLAYESLAVTIQKAPTKVYRLKLSCGTSVLLYEHLKIDDEALEPIDLLECQHASPEEVAAALAWEPPAPEPEPPKPEPPSYKRIPRDVNDAASYLGFHVGPTHEAQPFRLGPHWTAVGFHLSSPQICGAVAVSLNFDKLASDRLELAIFNAAGDCLLRVGTTRHMTRFDAVRLPAGDLLLTFKAPGVYGRGSSHVPHTKLLAELPEKPILDDIIEAPAAVFGAVAIPRFEFAS